jgi:indolepyruvate ferredoxin oxidoreductase alpha subunit
VLRSLERLGLADVYGRSQVPIYVMNVAYPVIESEVLRFAAGKRALLIVEEGQPNFIEQTLATVLRHGDSTTALHGKDLLPRAGEYTLGVVRDGLRAFLERYGRSRRRIARSRPPRSRRRRSLRTCTRGRRAFAPAAPSGRSSARSSWSSGSSARTT